MWGNIGAAVSPVLLNWIVKKSGYGWDGAFAPARLLPGPSGVAALWIDARVPVVPPIRSKKFAYCG